MGEIRRNVQGFQERNMARSGRESFGDDRPGSISVSLMQRKNRYLAAMLEESIANLKRVATSGLVETDKDKNVEDIEVATAKIQFVKFYLEDSSLALPEEDLPAISNLSISPQKENRSPTVALDTTPVVMTSSAVDTVRSTLSPDHVDGPTSPPIPERRSRAVVAVKPTVMSTERSDVMAKPPLDDADRMEVEPSSPSPGEVVISPGVPSTNALAIVPETDRPPAPIPTRSTLAQSSFSWMLEPDTSISRSPPQLPSFPSSRPSSSDPATGHKKRGPANLSRERNAFLFGEVTSEGKEERRLSEDEIFGLQPLRKEKLRS
jgi:TBC1 domain family protein 5